MEQSTSDILNRLAKLVEFDQFLLKSLRQIKSLESDPVKNTYSIASTIDAINKKLMASSEKLDEKKLIDEWLGSYLPNLEANKKQLHDSFGKSLESLLKAKGIELKGQYPELKAGIFTIELDFKIGQCQLWYGPKQEPLAKTKLDPDEISKKMESSLTQLKSPLNESSFIQQVNTAYINIIRKQNKPEGERVEIIPVLNELVLIKQDNRFRTNPLKEYYKEYTRAQFSYDLFRINKKALSTKLLVLGGAVRMDTASRTGFIWIPSDDKGNGSPYSHLYFKEDEVGTTSSH